MSAPYSICHDHTGVLLVVRKDGLQHRSLVRTAEEFNRVSAWIMQWIAPDDRRECFARLRESWERHLEAAMDRLANTAPHDTEAP